MDETSIVKLHLCLFHAPPLLPHDCPFHEPHRKLEGLKVKPKPWFVLSTLGNWWYQRQMQPMVGMGMGMLYQRQISPLHPQSITTDYQQVYRSFDFLNSYAAPS